MDSKCCGSRITRNVRNCSPAQASAAPLRQLKISPTSCFLLHKFCSCFHLSHISIYFHNSTLSWQTFLPFHLRNSVRLSPTLNTRQVTSCPSRPKKEPSGWLAMSAVKIWIGGYLFLPYLVINVEKSYWLQRYQVFSVFKPRRTFHSLVNMPICQYANMSICQCALKLHNFVTSVVALPRSFVRLSQTSVSAHVKCGRQICL